MLRDFRRILCATEFSNASEIRCSNKSLGKKVQEGEYQLVYITPELLITSSVWRKMLVGELYSERLRALVVDETHTVKKW